MGSCALEAVSTKRKDNSEPQVGGGAIIRTGLDFSEKCPGWTGVQSQGCCVILHYVTDVVVAGKINVILTHIKFGGGHAR